MEGEEKKSLLSPRLLPLPFFASKTFVRLKKTPALQANHLYKRLFRLSWKSYCISNMASKCGKNWKKWYTCRRRVYPLFGFYRSLIGFLACERKSGFHAVDSGFQVMDAGFQTLVGFRIPWAIFWIPKPKIRIPQAKFSRIPYHGARSSVVYYWTDSRQHWIDSFLYTMIRKEKRTIQLNLH